MGQDPDPETVYGPSPAGAGGAGRPRAGAAAPGNAHAGAPGAAHASAPDQPAYAYPTPVVCPYAQHGSDRNSDPGRPRSRRAAARSRPHRHRRRSSKPVIGGSLMIISGVLGIIMAVGMLVGGAIIGSFLNGDLMATDHVALVEGSVNDLDHAPVANATVSVVGTTAAVRTNETGFFRLTDVPVGFHKIRIERDGFKTLEYSTFVHNGYNDVETCGKHKDVRLSNDNTYNFTLIEGTGTVNAGFPQEGLQFIPGLVVGLGVLVAGLSVVAIIGGVFAIKCKRLWFVILAAIAGVFAIGFFIGAVLAFVALFIVLLAYREFKRAKREGEDAYEYDDEDREYEYDAAY